MNAAAPLRVHTSMQYKRTYYNAETPVATPIFRTIVIPTELVMGLFLAMRGEPVKPE